MSDNKPYLIISWNVNGYTDDIHLYLSSIISSHQPDVIFLSEIKKKKSEISILMDSFIDYNIIINEHNPTRWHGVLMLIRKNHLYQYFPVYMGISVRSDNKSDEASKGRIIIICLNKELFIIGSYTPNSGKSDKNKLDYRTKIWDPAFFDILEQLRESGPTIWIGDINVALNEIDVSNPVSMAKYAGVTPEERSNFRNILNSGNWIDIWRHQHPTQKAYTWCGCPPRVNYGLRIDNIIISKCLLQNVLDSFIISDGIPLSSDHLLIGSYIKRRY
jgi:exodeoxyribonuclease III